MSVAVSPEADYAGATLVAGVSALARDFDGFIVDQWGVLHDGTRPYAGAIDCLERLRANGKRVVVLSNTGRREADAAALMTGMGIGRHLYERCIAAGENAREAIRRRSDPFHAALGTRCYTFTRAGDVALIEGLGLEIVPRVEDAEFLMVLGIDSPERSLADYEAELVAGAARGLRMVCANPDVTAPYPQGLRDAAGALARRYEALGGEVFYHGKPYPAIYGSCFEVLAPCARERIVAIGDSMEHDVLGATRAGVQCAFVTGGIHAADLDTVWGTPPTPDAWRRFIHGAPARPGFLLPAFGW